MAVYRWIYANAKMEGNRKDYHVRMCDPALEPYKQTLILLSSRLLSTGKRYGKGERQTCWFAGYLDKTMYLVAIGGDQKELLGVSPDGYRNQHCVLAYGFTGNDIGLYQKSEKMFEPLKEILREIQRTGRDIKPDGESMTKTDFSAYAENHPGSGGKSGANIRMSTRERDEGLWKLSLHQPVMTGIISVEDAKKLLQLFPGGTVTVMEDVELTYSGQEAKGAKSMLQALEESEEKKRREKEKEDKELAELKQRMEASQRKLEEIEAAKQRKERIQALLPGIALAAACIFGALVYLLAG